MPVKGHGHKIPAEILYLHSLHLIEGESSQKKIIINVTNLEYRLDRDEPITRRLHHDGPTIMNKLHLLIKGKRNSSDSMDPWSA